MKPLLTLLLLLLASPVWAEECNTFDECRALARGSWDGRIADDYMTRGLILGYKELKAKLDELGKRLDKQDDRTTSFSN